MRLQKIIFSEYQGKPSFWEVEDFKLSTINLITAKNATGKSRLLNVISNLALLLEGKRGLFVDANYEAHFQDGDDTYVYTLISKDMKVVKEKFVHNDTIKLDRGNSDTTNLYFEQLDQTVVVNIPSETLCINRRDKLQHPFFEKLNEWGSNTVLYKFGADLGQHTLFSSADKNKNIAELNIKDTNNVQFMFLKAKRKYNKVFIDKVIKDFNKLGYNINDLGISPIPGLAIPNSPIQALSGLYVKENTIKPKVFQNVISQGMFRALSLLIQLNYLELYNIPGCVIIDDIGEGLDFDRSTKLIEIIISKAQNSFVQLIMSTNDRFVMNAVDLKYWNVVIRDKQKCKVLNYTNSREIFDDFEFTGLNNFDFLSSEFYNNGFDEK